MLRRTYIKNLVLMTLLLSVLLLSGCLGYKTNNITLPERKIPRENIHLRHNQIVIDITKGYNYTYTLNGNSMYPIITNNSMTIGFLVDENTKLDVNNIIIFKMLRKYVKTEIPEDYYINDSTLIFHRIIKKGIDSEGEYFIMKGDNNWFKDKTKIRREDILYVVAMIIY